MTIAKILATIEGTPESEAVLVAALHLGQRFGAQVHLLHVEQDPTTAVPVLGEGMSGVIVEQMIKSLEERGGERLAEAQRQYQALCVDAGIASYEPEAPPPAGSFAVCFDRHIGFEADEVQRLGRLSDVIVLPAPGAGEEGALTASHDAALFDSGRPVLMVPAGHKAAFGANIAVAWDGSLQASRAVAAALPLLGKAGSVIVLTGREDADVPAPSELVGYLKAHGIDAKTWAFSLSDGGIGSDLLAQLDTSGADMLVMGAYGHSRIREIVLGGATRGVLSAAHMPMFMAH